MIRKRNIFRQPCSIHWNKKTCKIYDGHKVMQLSYAKDLQTSFGDKSVKSVRGRTDSVWTILYIQCMPSTIRSVCDVMDSLTLNRSLNSLSLNRRLRRKRLEKRVNFETRMEVLGGGNVDYWSYPAVSLCMCLSAGRRRQDWTLTSFADTVHGIL